MACGFKNVYFQTRKELHHFLPDPPSTLSKWHFRCYQEWNEKCSVIWRRSLLTIRWLNATVLLYFQLPMPPNRGRPSGNHSRSSNIPAILVTAGGAHFSNIGFWKRNMEVFVKPISARNVPRTTVLTIMTGYKDQHYGRFYLCVWIYWKMLLWL